VHVRRVARVLVDELGHFEVALRHVVSHVYRFPRRQGPVLQVLLPSSGFEDSRPVLR